MDQTFPLNWCLQGDFANPGGGALKTGPCKLERTGIRALVWLLESLFLTKGAQPVSAGGNHHGQRQSLADEENWPD
jgi:hypothetical protein